MSAREAIRAALDARNAHWVDPPVLQPAALYLELSGEDIRRRAFLVADDAGEMCLRPDMTVPAIRVALAHKAVGVIAYEGLVFRRQAKGSARESEFVQIGAEWLGRAEDADILACALEACRAAGVEPKTRLGDLALVSAFAESFHFAKPWDARVKRALARPGGLEALKAEIAADASGEGAALADALAAVPEAEAEAALADMLAAARITPVGGRSLADIARRLRARGEAHRAPKPKAAELAALAAFMEIDAPAAGAAAALAKLPANKEAKQAIEAAAARLEKLNAADAPKDARFAPGLGRGLSYYDGFVFEFEAPSLGEQASLGGGGRYDGLVRSLAAHEMAPERVRIRIGEVTMGFAESRDAVGAGFALRPARLALAAGGGA
ncbi:MAG: ATP phosphoribosyltransferase regulatory subunit [Hyphomonadaceae bacterium]